MTQASIVLDSINSSGNRLTTIAVEHPRFILAEIGTHRMLSRSYASSRAIPVAETLRRVQQEPFMPTYWGKNERGMQASEQLADRVIVDFPNGEWLGFDTPNEAWEYGAQQAALLAKGYTEAGYHKQLVNRILEPYSYVTGILTATEWQNFFTLRLHPDAQPEFQELARCIKAAMDGSTPTLLEPGEWHLPYITGQDELDLLGMPGGGEGNLAWVGDSLRKVSAARCARASFASNKRGQSFAIAEDLMLYSRLFGPPLHAGPTEHQGSPMYYTTQDAFMDAAFRQYGLPGAESAEWPKGTTHMDRAGNLWSANFKGFTQFRAILQ